MPKIFTEQKKTDLYQSLKRNCIDLMRKRGYKGFNIRDVTKVSGISTGTFYNFYTSKEDLVLEIVEDYQNNLQKRFIEIANLHGGVNKEDFIDLYYFSFMRDNTNIFRYLSRDDLSILLSANKNQSIETIKMSMIENARHFKNSKSNINFSAVINFTQLINLCLENQDILVREEIANTVRKLLNNIADEIFEEV